MVRLSRLASVAALLTACATANAEPSARRSAHGHGRAALPAPHVAPNPAAEGLDLPPEARACYDRLWRGGVTFELVDRRRAAGVKMPIRLASAIGGVWVAPRNRSRVHSILDCRLALRILHWSGTLRRAGVAGMEHYSVYRPGARIRGSGKVSGHAHALAIDLARLHMRNGAILDVLTDWEERQRGGEPCPMRHDEAWAGRVLRGVVCEAVTAGLFQVVLTPHHDAAHQNHVHLEFRPSTDWTYIQ
ncbi:MAG: extensin family protein [Myxococcales bacterium]|nr:extensin family protein [Myxococcales bacterium]